MLLFTILIGQGLPSFQYLPAFLYINNFEVGEKVSGSRRLRMRPSSSVSSYQNFELPFRQVRRPAGLVALLVLGKQEVSGSIVSEMRISQWSDSGESYVPELAKPLQTRAVCHATNKCVPCAAEEGFGIR